MTAREGSSGPLSGISVADFSRVLAGPLATMMLGDLGADVVKIEQPGIGDVTRSWGPPFTASGESAYYLAVNRNKRSVALDLTDDADRAKAEAIIASSDVVIENFRDGTMKRFGLDAESLLAGQPELIYCRISGFGSGAGANLPGYDFLVQALSGLMSVTGEPDGPPTKTGVAIVDVLTGLHATIGVLAAVHERHESGRGQIVEVNLLSSALASLVNQASSYLAAGVVPGRMSNRHPNIAPYETFETSSLPIAIAVGSDEQFKRLCSTLGMPRAASDPRWMSNEGRVRARDELVEALESVLTSRSCHEWVAVLQREDIPCGPIHQIDEAFSFASDLGLDPVQRLETPDGRTVDTVSNPITLSRTPASYRMAPPDLGAADGALGRERT